MPKHYGKWCFGKLECVIIDTKKYIISERIWFTPMKGGCFVFVNASSNTAMS